MCSCFLIFFFVHAHNCEGQMLASHLSVCPSAWNLSPTGQICLKLCTCGVGGVFTKTFRTSRGQIFTLLTCYAAWIDS